MALVGGQRACRETGLPLAQLPAGMSRSFQGVDFLFVQYAQRITSKGKKLKRVLGINPHRVILTDDAGAIKRFVRHDLITQIVITRGPQENQLGIIVPHEFPMRLVLSTQARPNVDDFVGVIRSIATLQERNPPEVVMGDVAKSVPLGSLRKGRCRGYEAPVDKLRRLGSPSGRKVPPPTTVFRSPQAAAAQSPGQAAGQAPAAGQAQAPPGAPQWGEQQQQQQQARSQQQQQWGEQQ
eukprot:Hpha_TRINITY_DN15396_c2_g1::TRINITY_DN15396_c2_g1_i1::g.88882::m.88882